MKNLFQDHSSKAGIELATCMGDVLTHLESFDKVVALFMKVYESLEPGGRFVITFRDLTYTLKGIDRIIPFQSDEQKIMTTFLEYQGDYVNVHDIIYIRIESGWRLKKGVYKKLRIGTDQAQNFLKDAGFKIDYCGDENGFVRIIASK